MSSLVGYQGNTDVRDYGHRYSIHIKLLLLWLQGRGENESEGCCSLVLYLTFSLLFSWLLPLLCPLYQLISFLL